jgi:hypothetical protein
MTETRQAKVRVQRPSGALRPGGFVACLPAACPADLQRDFMADVGLVQKAIQVLQS